MDDTIDLWDEWMHDMYLSELTGEGELPRWALGSSVFE